MVYASYLVSVKSCSEDSCSSFRKINDAASQLPFDQMTQMHPQEKGHNLDDTTHTNEYVSLRHTQ